MTMNAKLSFVSVVEFNVVHCIPYELPFYDVGFSSGIYHNKWISYS